jgi:taurine dioxygenase|tara:strand:- start:844 stop:1701 length:858 start_codon:yes stop_codon:yes gene_type:complete
MFQVKLLSATHAAEISGIDLSQPIDDALAAAIRQAWLNNLVLLFRDQTLTDAQLVTVAKVFGEPAHSPPNASGSNWLGDFPELTCISNIKADGKPIGSLGNGEAIWHTDMSYTDEPPTASLLYALEVPPAGGGTHIMNMYTAYDTLPDTLKEQVEGKIALHDATYTSSGDVRKIYTEFDGNTDPEVAPGARHPLVIRHPETGRKALFLGRRSGASGILGEPDTCLYDALWAHCEEGGFSWRQEWRVGDLLVWDNRCCMHYRESFDDSDRRLMHRAQIKGVRPVAA